MTEAETYSNSSALSLSQIKSFYDKAIFEKSQVEFSFCYLKELNKKDLSTIVFIHTGETKDNINNGYTNHWLVLDGNKLFDSYGYYDHYNLESLDLNFDYINTIPDRLQAFDATVCGEYCLHFINFIYEKNLDDESEIGKKYSTYYGFNSKRNENDEKVLTWYQKNK